MVTITARYEGSFHCTAQHGPSDSTLDTDAPKDNQGRGEAFSPTDLVGTALLTCAMTTMAIVAKHQGFEVGEIKGTVEKGMVADPKRRIGSLPIRLEIAGQYTDEQKQVLEQAGKSCPVASSLSESVDAPMTFSYTG